MVKTRADDRVGAGMKLKALLTEEQFPDEDKRQKYSREIQTKFMAWMRHVKLSRKFRIIDRASAGNVEAIGVQQVNQT